MPTCMAITNSDIVVEDRPIPPCAGGSRRYAGTHALRPHHANRQHEFIRAIATVTLLISGLNSVLKRPRSVASAVFHIAGSSTLRRIHIVNSAGSTPTKKTPRQPHRGM